MSVHPPAAAFADAQAAHAAPSRDLLRFITCGSVDDGKSTLIGRLLYDSKQLFDDQLSALARDSEKFGTQDGALDLALALDGLAAEREQGITIDVAYRFFSTERRSFIVADTPGHVEYTRNMATGASTADAAVLLVDARKGLSPQTRRHTLLVATLGIRHVVVALNKMDLVGWSEATFEAIMAEYRAFAQNLDFASIQGIPLSAKLGDNVTTLSEWTPWYRGPALLSHLEELDPVDDRPGTGFRMPVQWVNRPNPEFRGFAGTVSGGPVRVGQRVAVAPSGSQTTVARIVTYDGDLDEALPGQSVTLVLADETDVSRGSILAAASDPPRISENISVRLFWMAKTPLRGGATYLVKLGTATALATIGEDVRRVSLDTLDSGSAASLEANDVGDVTLVLDRAVGADPYRLNRETGSLILIDRESLDTVGMALVLEAGRAEASAAVGTSAQALDGRIARWLPAPFAAPWRSALKAATWRIAGSGLTVSAAYWLTGDLRIALLLGTFELVVKFALQFGHERLWTRIGLGLRHSSVPASPPHTA